MSSFASVARVTSHTSELVNHKGLKFTRDGILKTEKVFDFVEGEGQFDF